MKSQNLELILKFRASLAWRDLQIQRVRLHFVRPLIAY